MVSHSRYAVLCVIVLLLISGTGHSAAGDGLLSGIIKDGNGAVIPGAAVRIQHWIVDVAGKKTVFNAELAFDPLTKYMY